MTARGRPCYHLGVARIILHVDLNAFFVRAEEIRNPSLIGKPVIIGHKGRKGVVATCSYKAREYGIHSGMPTFQALSLCPEAIVIGGDYPYYAELSRLFVDYLRTYTKDLEQTSIDECYLDLTERLSHEKDVPGFLKRLQDGLLKKSGLQCSIGVGPSRFLAKMASDMKKPLGITIIRRKDARKILSPLPIERFYGIGKKTAPRLREMGIKTIGDLIEATDEDDPKVMSLLGKFYEAVKQSVNGYGNDVVESEPRDPKSIGNSNTLMHDSQDVDELKEEIDRLAKHVSERAKRHGKLGTTVELTLKDNQFRSIVRSKTLQEPTNDEERISEVAGDLLEKNYKGAPIRLVGVTLENLIDAEEVHLQMSIFDDPEAIEKEYATKLLIGRINRKFNKGVLKTAADYLKENKDGKRR